MYTDDAYYETSEFKEILSRYEDTPTLLDADDLTEVADYYLSIGDEKRSQEAIDLATRMYPDAAAPLSFKTRGALEEGNCEEAERLFAQIADTTSDDYSLLQGEIFIAKEEDDKAATLFKQLESKSLEADWDGIDHEDLVIEVANIYSNYSLFKEAVEWVAKCEDKEDPDYLELVARSSIGIGKPDEALTTANKLLDIDAFSKRSWHILASAQFALGDYEESINSCDYALAIDPGYEPCLYMKANCLFNVGKYEEAIDFYRRSRSIAKGDSWLYLNEGTCLLNLGRFDEAIDKLTAAEQAADADEGPLLTIYKELAFAYGSNSQPDLAMTYLDKVAKEEDDPIELDMLRGHVMLQSGRYNEALGIFINLMERTNREPQTLLRIAVSLYDNKHYKTAYIFFQILMADNEDNEDFKDGFAYMALCCKAMGKPEEFLCYMLMAAERNPNEAQLVLGQFFPDNMEPKEYLGYLKKMSQQMKDYLDEKKK